MEGAITVRSFRVCFDLERRIHRIDRWRLPMPYGLPVRSVAYWAAALAAILLLGGLPVTGDLLTGLPVPFKLVVLPAGVAYGLTQLRVDGRAAHRAGAAFVRHALGPRAVVAFRPVRARAEHRVEDVRLVRDEAAARYRRSVVRGPAVVTLRYPARARRRRRTLRLEQTSDRPMWRGKQVVLRDGQRLELV